MQFLLGVCNSYWGVPAPRPEQKSIFFRACGANKQQKLYFFAPAARKHSKTHSKNKQKSRRRRDTILFAAIFCAAGAKTYVFLLLVCAAGAKQHI